MNGTESRVLRQGDTETGQPRVLQNAQEGSGKQRGVRPAPNGNGRKLQEGKICKVRRRLSNRGRRLPGRLQNSQRGDIGIPGK